MCKENDVYNFQRNNHFIAFLKSKKEIMTSYRHSFRHDIYVSIYISRLQLPTYIFSHRICNEAINCLICLSLVIILASANTF